MTLYTYTYIETEEMTEDLLRNIIKKDTPNNSEILSLIRLTCTIKDFGSSDDELKEIINTLFLKLTSYNTSLLSLALSPIELAQHWETIQEASAVLLTELCA